MRPTGTLLATMFVLAACAANSPAPRAGTERPVVLVQTGAAAGGDQLLQLTRENNITSLALPGEVAEAWAGLPHVFEALGLPITAADGSRRVLASMQRVRHIGGRSPASYFRCPGPYGNRASSGDVYLSLRTQIVAAEEGGGSVIHIQVQATARSRTSATRVRCSDNGSLQKLIGETLASRLERR